MSQNHLLLSPSLFRLETEAAPSRTVAIPRPAQRAPLAPIFHDFAIPALLYTLCFFLLTYPLVLTFSTTFYCNNGDGLQNEWNLWWVRKAIVELHQAPWFTTWLHAPQGTTLIGHTLNPFNGLIG